MTPARLSLDELTPADDERLAAALAAARLVCFPTDTVYGIGGFVGRAVVDALVAAKGRDEGKPLQVIFPSADLLIEAVAPPDALCAALLRLLPGALTLVIPYPPAFSGPPPGHSRGGRPTLGVRVPAWLAPMAALGRLRRPLVASSANLSGRPSASRLDEVAPQIRDACDLLLDGGPAGGLASTVVDLSEYEAGTWEILRDGAVSREAVAAALGASVPR